MIRRVVTLPALPPTYLRTLTDCLNRSNSSGGGDTPPTTDWAATCYRQVAEVWKDFSQVTFHTYVHIYSTNARSKQDHTSQDHFCSISSLPLYSTVESMQPWWWGIILFLEREAWHGNSCSNEIPVINDRSPLVLSTEGLGRGYSEWLIIIKIQTKIFSCFPFCQFYIFLIESKKIGISNWKILFSGNYKILQAYSFLK